LAVVRIRPDQDRNLIPIRQVVAEPVALHANLAQLRHNTCGSFEKVLADIIIVNIGMFH
jgi:hypothetical protein